MDETRVERALREGPPFCTRYVASSLPVGAGDGVRPVPLRSWVLAAVVIMLALVLGGEALIGSGIVKLPVLTHNSGTSSPTPEPPGDRSTWTATGAMVTQRSGGHTVTLLANGMVLVAGGAPATFHSESLAAAELFSPTSMSWTSTGEMIQARSGHTATLLADGRVLVAGGGDPNGNGRKFRTAELYDPATGSWAATGDMAKARTNHTATLLPNGKVMVAGGNGGGPFLASAELYDPVTGTWTAIGDMTEGRSAHTATLLADGRVLVAGGVFGDDAGPCCGPLSSAELFDPHAGTWTATGSFAEIVGGGSATLLPDGRVLVAGEINSFRRGGSPAEIYDPGSGSWTVTGSMAEHRNGLAATLLPDGRVLVLGGVQDTAGDDTFPIGFTGLRTAELYVPSSGSWTSTRNMGTRRGGQVGVRLADGRVLVVGGVVSVDGGDGSSVLSEPAAEVFDPDGGS
jgi:N-acetylneuraminic acid mutarotase